jgi:hypothetical protein
MAKQKQKKLSKTLPSDERIDWARNQALIQQTYIDLIKELKRCPTSYEVSQRVKISVTTIKKHVRQMKFEPQESPLRVLSPDVLISVYNSARKGTSASQKLWFQIMEGWVESTEVNLKNSIADLVRQNESE